MEPIKTGSLPGIKNHAFTESELKTSVSKRNNLYPSIAISELLTKIPWLIRYVIAQLVHYSSYRDDGSKETREFEPLHFLAELSQHIPDEWEQPGRY